MKIVYKGDNVLVLCWLALILPVNYYQAPLAEPLSQLLVPGRVSERRSDKSPSGSTNYTTMALVEHGKGNGVPSSH